MCLDQFFGEVSPFQIIVSVVALITGIYTFYKSFLERSKIFLYMGDAVRIVVSPDGSVANLHLMCNLINKSIKAGTLHRLEVCVTDPNNTSHNFIWNLFYKYLAGGEQVQKESDIYPVAVPQKDSKLLFVGFQSDSEENIEWLIGRYKVRVNGWVNRKNLLQSSNLKTTFHIEITKDIVDGLKKPDPSGYKYIPVPIVEWKRQHR